jgi:hypothetical protein
MTDLLEDYIRAIRWFTDTSNRNEAIAIAAEFTKLPVANFDGWLFNNKDHYRDPNGMPDLDALQKSMQITKNLGFLKLDIDVKNFADLTMVEEASKRLNRAKRGHGTPDFLIGLQVVDHLEYLATNVGDLGSREPTNGLLVERLAQDENPLAQGAPFGCQVDVEAAMILGLAFAHNELAAFHKLDRLAGCRLPDTHTPAQFALGKAVLIPELAEEIPLTERDSVRFELVTEGVREGAVGLLEDVAECPAQGVRNFACLRRWPRRAIGYSRRAIGIVGPARARHFLDGQFELQKSKRTPETNNGLSPLARASANWPRSFSAHESVLPRQFKQLSGTRDTFPL